MKVKLEEDMLGPSFVRYLRNKYKKRGDLFVGSFLLMWSIFIFLFGYYGEEKVTVFDLFFAPIYNYMPLKWAKIISGGIIFLFSIFFFFRAYRKE